jgi:hypothetical protein
MNSCAGGSHLKGCFKTVSEMALRQGMTSVVPLSPLLFVIPKRPQPSRDMLFLSPEKDSAVEHANVAYSRPSTHFSNN